MSSLNSSCLTSRKSKIPHFLISPDYDDFEQKYKHIWVIVKAKNTSPAVLKKRQLKASGWDFKKGRRQPSTKLELTPMTELLRNVMMTGTVPIKRRSNRGKLINALVALKFYSL